LSKTLRSGCLRVAYAFLTVLYTSVMFHKSKWPSHPHFHYMLLLIISDEKYKNIRPLFVIFSPASSHFLALGSPLYECLLCYPVPKHNLSFSLWVQFRICSNNQNHEFGVYVSVQHDKFLMIKPTRCTNFSNLFLK